MINNNLEQLAKEYINDVNKVCQMILQAYNLKSREELIKHREAQPTGEFYLNGNNSYTFHGRGCRFSNNELEIDWDFGYGENWCGIDPWKLAYYIRENKTTETLYDGNKIKEELENLITKSKFIKKFDLYYLA